MKSLLVLFVILFPLSSFAIVNEVAFDFGYDRQIYGLQRQNSSVNRTYSAALSTYIFDYTAIDLNASRSSDITTENERYNVTTGIDVVGQQNRVTSNVYGIGIKQMFAPRTARLIPGISIGYAKQFLNYNSDLTIEDTSTKARTNLAGRTTKQRIDSVFGTLSLQLRMTERLSLKGSVKTLFPAFELDKARDNVKYAIGFSWVF
nr:autotransporter domain-containing protein [Bacteriovorax sp. HI3]